MKMISPTLKLLRAFSVIRKLGTESQLSGQAIPHDMVHTYSRDMTLVYCHRAAPG